jgi:hypothetical protein
MVAIKIVDRIECESLTVEGIMLWVGSLIGSWQESPYTGTMPERGEVACRLLETVQRCLDMVVFFLNGALLPVSRYAELFQICLLW